MEDEWVLLKIRRQFKQDEATNALLKIIDEVRFENGVLKSDLSEAKYEIHKLKNSLVTEGRKTKKEWLKEDLIIEMTNQIKQQQSKNAVCNKSLNEWRNKYYSLVAKTQK